MRAVTSKRRKWLLILAGGLALPNLVLFLTREREPSYEGKSLSEWVEIYARDSKANDPASKAIRHIGTNAVPYLLKWVSYESPKNGIKKSVANLIDKLPDGIKPYFLEDWTQSRSKVERAWNSAHAFSIFREESSLCIPPLVKMMNNTNSPDAAENATCALAWIGPDAEPIFAATLADTNAPAIARRNIPFVLGIFANLYRSSPHSVPLLLQCLQDTDQEVKDRAVRSLGFIGAESRANASVVVPVLTNCLRADYPLTTRYAAADSLSFYGNEARVSVPLLLNLTNSPDFQLRSRVTRTLMFIAPEVLNNAPAK